MPKLVFLLVFLLAVAAPALASVPDKGEGTITLLGGMRAIPSGGYGSETGASHALVQPGVLLGFGYQPDDDLHAGIQLGYGADQYGAGATALKIRSFQVLLALDTALVRSNRFTFYAGGGIGYSLNTSSRAGRNVEANSTAGFVALGLRARIVDHLAIVVEDRYTLSSANVDPAAVNGANVGGNFLGVGLQFHFLSPEDKRPGD